MPTNAQSLTPSRPAPQSSRAQQLDAYGAPVTHRGWTNPIELLMKWIADDPVKNAKTVAEIVVGPYGAYEDAGRARKSFSKGNYGEAAFDATMMGLGALPLGGAMVKGIKAARGPVYRSRLASALEDMPMDKMSGQQAVSHFKKYPGGVGADELDYTGVGAMTQQPSVTKTDLLNQYNANPLEIKDVVRADEIAGYGVTQNIDDLRRRYEMMTGPKPANQHLLPPSQRRNIAWAPEKVQAELARINAMERANITGPTKFGPGSEYNATLPGGKDYQEMSLTLPGSGDVALKNGGEFVQTPDGLWNIEYPDGGTLWHSGHKSLDEAKATAAADDMVASRGQTDYRGGHFPEPNVLVHGRYNTRNIDGDKTLFIEEIQSDWHQAGRKRGYMGREKGLIHTLPEGYTVESGFLPPMASDQSGNQFWRVLDPDGNPVTAQSFNRESAVNAAINDINNSIRGTTASPVPNAPYKATDKWQGLAFQRMVRHAAENGHDRIAWTPGKVQAERYDLSTQIDGIEVIPEGNNQVEIMVKAKGEDSYKTLATNIPEDKIADHIGKELAEKAMKKIGDNSKDTFALSREYDKFSKRIRDGEVLSDADGDRMNEVMRLIDSPQELVAFTGVDLEIGGEGMKEFYDKILVKNANKFAKKYGQKVEVKNLWGPDLPRTLNEQVWSLKITDKMKKDILKGGVALSGTGVAASSLLAGQEDYY